MKHFRIVAISLVLVIALGAFMSPATAVFAEGGDDDVEVEEVEGEEDEENFFCTADPEEYQHPVAAGIAELYGIEYDEVMLHFCEEVDLGDGDDAGFGFGQIMLAYETGDPNEALALRMSGMGWGEIWQLMGKIGKPDKAGPPWWADNDYDGDGPPPWAGKKDKEK
jgi:hypothetical protein